MQWQEYVASSEHPRTPEEVTTSLMDHQGGHHAGVTTPNTHCTMQLASGSEQGMSPDLDGRGPGNGRSSRIAGQGTPRGDDQLNGVADDDGVVYQVPVGRVLQHGALHELAVAVAVARVGVLNALHPNKE